ncbi:hypothetical protein IEQ34_017116 [Dendrobium chrysotoxum]|uniref:Inositol-1-monophosphatase n=1 Tax=Dendrobium chrysotoxum TaxID=161865 RepID=A0AAV7GB50_DENCH|nr:hypothetical protein IEQ34_017116 [Dendrobium chrysotoxum]
MQRVMRRLTRCRNDQLMRPITLVSDFWVNPNPTQFYERVGITNPNLTRLTNGLTRTRNFPGQGEIAAGHKKNIKKKMKCGNVVMKFMTMFVYGNMVSIFYFFSWFFFVFPNGTTNFAHCYPSFGVSIGVLFRGRPAAASVVYDLVEFVGGPMCWNTRTFTASSGGGAFCNGQKIHVSQTEQVERSLLVTGFGYEHDDAWATNMNLFKHFTDISRGVRRLGAAAVDMSHVALGIVEAYWEYRLKPWDMAAGVLIVEEAGGTVTCMDGGKFSVFDRSVLVSNGIVHEKLLERIGPATDDLKEKGIDFSQWFKPESYVTDI